MSFRTLQAKIVAVLAVFLVFPMAIVGAYFFYSLDRDLGSVEEEQLKSFSASGAKLLHQMGEDALNVAKSYSYWSEFRTAAASADMPWIEENVLTVTDVVSTVHFAALADLEGNVIGASGSAGFGASLEPALLTRFRETPDFQGLTLIDGKLAIVVVSGVTDEEGAAARTGALVFGRAGRGRVRRRAAAGRRLGAGERLRGRDGGVLRRRRGARRGAERLRVGAVRADGPLGRLDAPAGGVVADAVPARRADEDEVRQGSPTAVTAAGSCFIFACTRPTGAGGIFFDRDPRIYGII